MPTSGNVEILGPEGTRLVLPLASASERLGAFCIDAGLLMVIWLFRLLSRALPDNGTGVWLSETGTSSRSDGT